MSVGVSILIYGDSGIGKSTDVAYVYRRAVWLLTEPGGLVPAEQCIGHVPEHVCPLYDIDNPDRELRDVVENHVVPLACAGKISSVVLDTGSELADRMVAAWKARKMDVRQVFGRINDEFLTAIRRLINLKELGLDIVCICHEIGPERDDDGNLLRGGPLMPGKKLPRTLPPKFDIVLRAAISVDIGNKGRVYCCDPLDPSYIMKDRWGVTGAVQPMELAPIIYRIKNPGKEPPEDLLTKQLRQRSATGVV